MQKTPSPQSAIKSGSAHRPQVTHRQTPAQDHKVADGLLAQGVSAYDNARSAHPAHLNLLHLQRALGNRAVGQLIQAKFTMSRPHDPDEREADQVADRVMRMTEPVVPEDADTSMQQKPLVQRITHLVQREAEVDEEEAIAAQPVLQRALGDGTEDGEEDVVATKPFIQRQAMEEEEAGQAKGLPDQFPRQVGNTFPPISSSLGARLQRVCSACGEKMRRRPEEEEGLVQTNLVVCQHCGTKEPLVQPKGGPSQTPHVSSTVVANVHALEGGGKPLPQATRAFFEPRFGADFSHVRVHTDSRAAETANSIHAKAFTVGRNIAFGTGQYAPHSHEGRQLLAHELTHVVQQSSFRSENSPLRQHTGVAKKELDHSRPLHPMASASVTNRDPMSKLTAAAHAPLPMVSTLSAADRTENKDTRPLPGLIQCDFLTDVWHGLTEAGPAVTRAMQLVTTLIRNPSQLPIVLGAIVWEEIPEYFKGPIIDRVLQACLVLARAVELPSPPGVPIGTLLKHTAIGFLERALSFPTGMKVRVADRMARIITSPSMEFSLGFLKGLVVGLWDGLTGPFILLWDLIKIAYQIQSAQMRFIAGMFNQQERERLGQDVQAMLERVEGRLAQVVSQLMSGQSNPLAILRLINQLINAVLRQVESLGASLADAMLRFMNKPDRQLGESLGWVGGTLTFEVLLLVLTEGGYTVLKNSLQGLRLVVRAVKMGGRAWEALGPVRAALVGFRTFAASNRALAPLLEAVEEVFALLVRFLRFSYGVGGPGSAAARGAEHGVGAAERGAAREIRVADTATRETHEITLLADGRLIRCSDRCMQIAENIIERAGRLERTGLQAEGSRLTEEARHISDEARALKANEALSATEREAQEAALLHRAEALERQMAAAEQRLMEGLSQSADNAVSSIRTLLRENAGNSRLRQFEHELEALEQDIARNRELARETLDPEMRRLVEDEFRDLERRARELESRMRGELPAGPAAAEVPAYVRENLVPRVEETFLADSSRFTPTGKKIKGAQIYRGPDGRYYHIDTLHTGAAAEIEFYNSTGSKHLGTMNPTTGEVIGEAIEGRSLKRYL